jgi:tRNA (guanine-N7-)-methyltransferase
MNDISSSLPNRIAVNNVRFDIESKKKAVRSYVVRQGRMTAGQSRALIQHCHQYRLSLYAGPPESWHEVFGRTAPVVLEIGFGMGDSLLQMAGREPEKDFIGIDVYPPGVGSLIGSAVNKGLSNLKIYMADAVDVLSDCVPANSLSRVQIFFPDPWPKKKHHKRRLIQLPLIEQICRTLTRGGVLHLATDWQPYAEHMVEVLAGVPGLENSSVQGNYCERPIDRPLTKFENRGVRQGNQVWELIYRRSY